MGRGRARAVDLNAVVEDLATLVRDDFRRRGIGLTVALNPECGLVRADGARLRQVLLNLVRNASEAVQGRAQAAIRISTERDSERVRLLVDDNGPGVPAATRERIFEPFFTTKESGSGLGLSGSRAAVEEYGGTLVCTESPDGGARFVATLSPGNARETTEAVEAVDA
jgi:C4-dicarboxylate-specific signal transduction histidine kinase